MITLAEHLMGQFSDITFFSIEYVYIFLSIPIEYLMKLLSFMHNYIFVALILISFIPLLLTRIFDGKHHTRWVENLCGQHIRKHDSSHHVNTVGNALDTWHQKKLTKCRLRRF